MPFPHAEHASVAEEKIRGYLLNPSHPVGGPKAAWFASIGYTAENWQDLAEALLEIARTSEDYVAESSPFGVKYKVSGTIGVDRRGRSISSPSDRLPWVVRMLSEHSIVVLTRDIPDAGLCSGDVGAIVHVYSAGDAYEVEFVEGDGTTVAVVTLDSQDVRPIGSGELLHTRRRLMAERAEAREGK